MMPCQHVYERLSARANSHAVQSMLKTIAQEKGNNEECTLAVVNRYDQYEVDNNLPTLENGLKKMSQATGFNAASRNRINPQIKTYSLSGDKV